MQATSTKSLTIETKREKTVDDIKSKSVPLCKKSVVSNVDVAKTQDNDMEAKKLPKKKIAETTVKEICEYERKAANEGIVLQPDHVKHLGNIDDITQERKAQIEKDIESLKTDMEKTLEQNSKKGTDMKVRINENKCVLYETKDAETIDDQDDNDDVGDVDLY